MPSSQNVMRLFGLGLCLLISSCRTEGAGDPFTHAVVVQGGIVRLDTTRQTIYLVFTGHEYAEGGAHVAEVLRSRGVRASFFFTGDFYRTPAFGDLIRSLRDGGHYLGAHSDKHLLYASWEKRDSTLLTYEQWREDLVQNYQEMERFGVSRAEALFFMPPYEWYNDTISVWVRREGLRLVNFTPGTLTNADYTVPSMGNRYRSSDEIQARLFRVEEREGLNGHIILIHLGTHPDRADKFYSRLGPIIDLLRTRGYSFSSFSDLQH